MSTSATWSSIERLRWTIPMPPSRASAIASRASVTVSIAAETIGIASSILARQPRARSRPRSGSTSDSAGTSRTSSNVSPSRANFCPSATSRSTSSSSARRHVASQTQRPGEVAWAEAASSDALNWRSSYDRRLTTRRARARATSTPPRAGAASRGSKRPAPTSSVDGGAGGDRGAQRVLGAAARRPARRGSRRAATSPDADRRDGSTCGASRGSRRRRALLAEQRVAARLASVMSTLRAPSSAMSSSARTKSSSSSNSWPTSASASRWFGETRYGSASTPRRSGSPSESSTVGTPRRFSSRIASA